MIGRLSLTFDNGPTPGITERILEVLARHGLRVTFFVIGEKLRDKAAAGGHPSGLILMRSTQQSRCRQV
jgi:peptidoglycan/xylan/chitin deacetylase (PgdA/CDA1 family)